jgi:hypothetical protein
MKLTPRFAIAFLTFTTAALAAGGSARIGRKVWSPEVFAWRNFFKTQPLIEEQAGCPVRLVHARFYSFMAIGSAIGTVLRIDVKNVSYKPIYSFTISHRSPEPTDTGSGGWHPEKLLQSGQSETIGLSSNGDDRVTFTVDFVQFADGTVWYSDPPGDTVRQEGVRAGTQAAQQYLLGILNAEGAYAVMAALPFIHMQVDAPEFATNKVYGHFGFYNGVNNTALRVENAYRESGLSSVEKLLRQQSE